MVKAGLVRLVNREVIMSEDRQSKNGVIALGSDSTGISRLAIQAAARQIMRWSTMSDEEKQQIVELPRSFSEE